MAMSNYLAEERLRESACVGDLDAVVTLLKSNTNIDAQNKVNGWTALHWAVKRNNIRIITYLIDSGASKNVVSFDGKIPSMLTDNPEVWKLLDSTGISSYKKESLVITPNYLRNPPLCPQVDLIKKPRYSTEVESTMQYEMEELVLKVRVADLLEKDFIEIEMPVNDLTYERLVQISLQELDVKHELVKIRKLPNTILRKDKDVKRLQNYQELELILKDTH